MHETACRLLFEQQTHGLSGLLLQERQWVVFEILYPTVDVGFQAPNRVGLRVRLTCDQWNDQPPSIQLLNFEGAPLNPALRDPGGVFNPNHHPATGRPFICSAGSREYHTHTSHVNDLWDNYKSRSDYDLGGILTKVWRAWLKANP